MRFTHVVFSGRLAIRLGSLFMAVVLLASCASQRSPYRKKRNCDCPTWSQIELVEHPRHPHPSKK
ncbi:MAG: hypothetical protein ACFCUH_05030 [Flavobacteriales bacterium]